MKQYLDLLRSIESDGTLKPAAREGMPSTTSLFGHQFRHNLQDGFPLLTTKKMYWKGVVIELIWFLRGDTNIKFLVDNGVKIWNEDAYNYYLKLCKDAKVDPMGFEGFVASVEVGDLLNWTGLSSGYRLGDCGHQYGKVWRDFGGVDQIAQVVSAIKNSPASRRHMVTAIDPQHQNELALYWCHALFQFNCRPLRVYERAEYAGIKGHLSEEDMTRKCDGLNVPKYYLDCQLYQRSADVFLGVPFNIASYALLTHIIAHECGMIAGEFIHTFGDVHIYENHRDQVREQLSREPKQLPKLVINENYTSWGKMNASMVSIEGYESHSKIEAKLSTGLK